MEKPVFSTKIRYLPPPRNGRELIIRKSTVNTLRDPPAAEAVLGDIERTYDLLEKMASPSKHMNPCKS